MCNNTCGVCLWPGNMSWGCLLHLRCHQWEDCDLVFLHTLLPEAIIRRAQERTRSTPPSSPLSPGSRTSIKGEKHRRLFSLRCQVINNGAPACLPLLSRWSDWIEDLQTDTRDCASHFTESGPLQCKEGWNYWVCMEDTCPEYEVTHRDEFWGGIHQDKTFLAWDTTNNGTFSKC